MNQLPPEGIFSLGDMTLESGATLREAFIGYKTHGRLNADRTNAIVYPTQFAAQHNDIEWMIGPGRALDTERYFVIAVDQLGNGVSSSPSNTPPPQDRSRFPVIAIRDDVAAQYRLVTDGFGIRRLALVTGYSMGAQQSFQWGVSHPDFVQRIAPFCGTAWTRPHNAVFLEGVRAALTADVAWSDGEYASQPVRGLRAMARVYAGWGFSQAFYRQRLYEALGFGSVDEVLTGFWEARYLRRDANNLLSMLRTWQLNDVAATPAAHGDLRAALGRIQAKATVMAGQTDLYFTPEDVEADAALIRGARFRVIPSLWGHMAGAGLNPPDNHFIEQEIRALLA
jgi:homoserine O-acetyltransferase/O-succinyltransferase